MYIHTPSKLMRYCGPGAISKGRLLQRIFDPPTRTMPRPASRGAESESPLIELAGRSLSAPGPALPGMTQESPVCRLGCVAGGAQG